MGHLSQEWKNCKETFTRMRKLRKQLIGLLLLSQLFLNKQSNCGQQLASRTKTWTQVIKTSIQQQFMHDTHHANSTTKWLLIAPLTSKLLTLEVRWHQKHLPHDPCNEKKRHRQGTGQSEHTQKLMNQATLDKHFH